MKADMIVAKVLSDAQAASEQTISDARKKTEQMQAESAARIEAGAQRVRERVQEDGAIERQRLERMAELDERKRDLAERRNILDLVFAHVQRTMEEGDPAMLRMIFLRTAVAHAAGTETMLVGDVRAEWYTDCFLRNLNRELTAVGKPGQITLSPERQPGVLGLVLREGGADLTISPEEIVATVRPDLEPEIARAYFKTDAGEDADPGAV